VVTPTVALSIAGSDSGGGAGIQADLRTFAALGLHGACAVTALTAQNTTEVRGVVVTSPEFLAAQIDAVLEDLSVEAVKTGMLANASLVEVVVEHARAGRLPNLVVDPVLVSSTGHALMDITGIDAYRGDLIPCARVITPNLIEAAILARHDPGELDSTDAMVEVAHQLFALGPETVVVKGGHLGRSRRPGQGAGSPDVVVSAEGVQILPADRVNTGNDHGTGCSLSAAIACHLAMGRAPLEAITSAKAFVRRALLGATDWKLGSGHGPIDHLGWAKRFPGP
jgi:hydroxymethylpyrimidine/phosphomethylpyrimidine kinase